MAYYVAVEVDFNNNYESIKINNKYPQTLEEIDEYTTSFSNESILRHELYSNNSLKKYNYSRNITLFYQNEKTMDSREVKGKLLYKESKEYLKNPALVIGYIQKKSRENDYLFFKQLVDIVPENSIVSRMTENLALLLEKNAINKTPLESITYDMVTELSKILMYHACIDQDGIIVCSDKIHYESLHNLVYFITEYERNLNKTSNHTKTKRK